MGPNSVLNALLVLLSNALWDTGKRTPALQAHTRPQQISTGIVQRATKKPRLLAGQHLLRLPRGQCGNVVLLLRKAIAQPRQVLARAFVIGVNYCAREIWWAMLGSNQRPPACKAGALTN